MNEPEKTAFAGDWHGNTPWATDVIHYLARQEVDTIVHVGDYGYRFHYTYVSGVEEALAPNDQMLYFVDGNHDEHPWLWQLPVDDDGFHIVSDHVRYIPRGHRWEWWGLTWMGLGGAHSVDRPWRNALTEWWPTEWTSDEDRAKASEGGNVDIMIAHDCPSGVDIPGITRQNGLKNFPAMELNNADFHRLLIREVVNTVKPKLYVHGHYHTYYAAKLGRCMYVGLAEDNSSLEKNTWIVDKETLAPFVEV